MSCCGKFSAIAIGAAKAIVKAEQALSDKRMAFCAPCQKRNKRRCTLCNCFLNLKTRVDTEKCPLGKW